MKILLKLKLILLKSKFKSIYTSYDEYMASHDGDKTIVDYISSRRLDMCKELNGLMTKICELEYRVSGKIPFDIEKIKFE